MYMPRSVKQNLQCVCVLMYDALYVQCAQFLHIVQYLKVSEVNKQLQLQLHVYFVPTHLSAS